MINAAWLRWRIKKEKILTRIKLEARKVETVKRSKRTRHLIQIGGLALKSMLLERLDIPEDLDFQTDGARAANDSAILMGAFAHLVEMLDSPDGQNIVVDWRIKGRELFKEEKKVGNNEDI